MDEGQTVKQEGVSSEKDIPAFEKPEQGQNYNTQNLLWTSGMSYGSEVVRICFLDTNCSQGQQPAHQHRPSVVRLIEAALLHSV